MFEGPVAGPLELPWPIQGVGSDPPRGRHVETRGAEAAPEERNLLEGIDISGGI